MTEKRSVWTFSAVLGPLSLLPLGRPRGRFGVGGPTGSCKMRLHMETEHTGETVNSQWMTLNQLFNLWISSALMKRAALGRPRTCCCFRGRPLPLRLGSSVDWAVLGSGECSLVPVSLMPLSVQQLLRVWASKPGAAASRASGGEKTNPRSWRWDDREKVQEDILLKAWFTAHLS